MDIKITLISTVLLMTVIACDGGGDGDGDDEGDKKAPTVSVVSPLDGATNTFLNATLSVTFSESMKSGSFSDSTFIVKAGAAVVVGTLRVVGATATFEPDELLPVASLLTATVTTGVTDRAGNGLKDDFVWTFTTGEAQDLTAPVVLSTVPAADEVAVAPNRIVTATLNESLDPLSVSDTTFLLTLDNLPVGGVVTHVDSVVSFRPDADLAESAIYTATVTTGVRDVAGNPLAVDFVWSFTTSRENDTVAPTVISVDPVNGAIDVAVNRSVVVTFSEPLDTATISGATFTLAGLAPIVGAVTVSGAIATFRPGVDLAANAAFNGAIGIGVTDLAGNALASPFLFSFTTSATPARGPAPVLLGSAGSFVILAKSGVDTVPTSVVTGDIGTSPIDSTALTGFSLTVDASNEFSTSSQVTGRLYAADYTSPTSSNLTTAISDMATAYTDAAGRPTPDQSELGGGEIGGLTLVPGLYKWGTGVLISSDVTLSGGPNDVWIFQIAGDVTQANGTRVNLSGGAQAKNIFWQTFGQFQLGTTAHTEGIVLCQTAIVLSTGASVNGRLLAQTAVTIDQSTVTQPAD